MVGIIIPFYSLSKDVCHSSEFVDNLFRRYVVYVAILPTWCVSCRGQEHEIFTGRQANIIFRGSCFGSFGIVDPEVVPTHRGFYIANDVALFCASRAEFFYPHCSNSLRVGNRLCSVWTSLIHALPWRWISNHFCSCSALRKDAPTERMESTLPTPSQCDSPSDLCKFYNSPVGNRQGPPFASVFVVHCHIEYYSKNQVEINFAAMSTKSSMISFKWNKISNGTIREGQELKSIDRWICYSISSHWNWSHTDYSSHLPVITWARNSAYQPPLPTEKHNQECMATLHSWCHI